jgi:hypothetical protein
MWGRAASTVARLCALVATLVLSRDGTSPSATTGSSLSSAAVGEMH